MAYHRHFIFNNVRIYLADKCHGFADPTRYKGPAMYGFDDAGSEFDKTEYADTQKSQADVGAIAKASQNKLL